MLFQIANYQSVGFPSFWVRSPTRASGEIDKTIGFRILPRHLRRALKDVAFDQEKLDPNLRDELAPWFSEATLQPVSTFINSLRERLSAAGGAGSGGARVGGPCIQGALINPKSLI